MKEHQKEELKTRLAKLSPQERKTLIKRANSFRATHMQSDRRTPSVEELTLTILQKEDDDGPTGTVETVHRTTCDVDGQSLRIPPGSAALAPGDVVRHDGRQVTELLPRRTFLSRGDPNTRTKQLMIVANIDVVVIVVSCVSPPLHPRLIDRYLAAIWRGGAEPAIVLNKIDLHASEEDLRRDRDLLDPYRQMGIPIFEASAVDRVGAAELTTFLRDRLSVFVGHSGVGKSSLMNSIFPELRARIGAVAANQRGAHTTTWSSLHREAGMAVIDTPGVREFSVTFASPEEIGQSFPDFPEGCRFSGCLHLHEEDCAVKEALAKNRLARARYDSYRRLMEDAFPKAGHPPSSGFECRNCGSVIVLDGAGSQHRNHCPFCLHSVHLDCEPGDRLSGCGGLMEPVAVWVRKGGEWALIHRCRKCGRFGSNRIAADDNEMKLLSLAVRPLSLPPFPLDRLAIT